MTRLPIPAQTGAGRHEMWVRTRLQIEASLLESMRHGSTLIAAGFGSFAIFDGLSMNHAGDELPKAFALAATAVGVVVNLLAVTHFRKMAAWVDADEFGTTPAPDLPDEQRPVYLALGAAAIGIVSFVALLVVV